jgi:hypothetical protein
MRRVQREEGRKELRMDEDWLNVNLAQPSPSSSLLHAEVNTGFRLSRQNNGRHFCW